MNDYSFAIVQSIRFFCSYMNSMECECRFFRSLLIIIFIGLCFNITNATESVLRKANLKVLDIGNSYTEDATDLLPSIVKSSGSDVSDMCLYKAIRGGASFKNWYDRYYEKDNRDYSISKVLGGLTANIKTGSEKGTCGSLFREALEKEKWDVIIIHQVSTYAPYYDKWATTEDSGYLNELLYLLKELQPQATIGFLLVHSYWDNYSGNTQESSYERWKLIANSVKRLTEDYDISFVIPYGTAVENLRSSSLNNKYDLTRDGTHCGFGLCRYTAACCYYERLIAPRSGISVLGNATRYDASKDSSQYPATSVTDENAEIAQKAAILAVKNWNSCLNPEFFGKKYHLTYQVDGMSHKTYELEYGAKITPEDIPTKDGYTFSGWSEIPETMPANDVTITGSFVQDYYEIGGTTYVINKDGATIALGENKTGEVVIDSIVTINEKPRKITTIGEGAFLGCQNITSLTIPDGIQKILANAYKDCSGIKVLKLGKNVKYIGNLAFANIGISYSDNTMGRNEALNIVCQADEVPEAEIDSFNGTPVESATLLVDDALVNVYRSTLPWSKFGTIMGFEEYASSIYSVHVNPVDITFFSINGQMLDRLHKGMNLIKTSQGIRKVIMR